MNYNQFPFENLPKDIQNEILSSNKNYILKSQSLNKHFKQLTEKSYLEQICTLPISKREILTFLNTLPNVFSYTIMGTAIIHKLYIKFNDYYDYYSLYSYYPWINVDFIHNINTIDTFKDRVSIDFDSSKSIILDPLTEYLIISNRQNCKKLSTQNIFKILKLNVYNNLLLYNTNDVVNNIFIKLYLYSSYIVLKFNMISDINHGKQYLNDNLKKFNEIYKTLDIDKLYNNLIYILK